MDGGNRSFDILRGLPELKYGRLFLSLKHSRVKDHNIIFYFFFFADEANCMVSDFMALRSESQTSGHHDITMVKKKNYAKKTVLKIKNSRPFPGSTTENVLICFNAKMNKQHTHTHIYTKN